MLAIKTPKIRYYFIFVLAFAALAGGFFLFLNKTSAQDSGSAVVDDLNLQIDEQRAKIDELSAQIDKYNENIKTARGQATSLQNQIYILDNQIAKTNLDIQAEEERIKGIELEIEKIELQIKTSEDSIKKDKVQLAEFIRTLDQYDEKSYLAVLLGNDSFSEFFDQVKYLESIQGDLQKTLNRFQELVTKLDEQKSDLNAKKEQISELLKKMENEKSNLAGQKQDKKYLIAETKKSEKKFKSLISELQQAQNAVNSQIASLEKKLREELAKKGAQEKFNTLGDAALAWPTDSRVINVYFRDPDYPFRNLFEHSGIDIKASSGTPVRAAESGYVAKVAVGTRWYGTYVMIIHSNNLATLYAHFSSAAVKADQYVTKGQIIGYSGNTGFSTGPHLHFETRLNGIPVNPLSYLP
ncbi:MAG: peptidoglycan DD-metalloendopeptidase family protein [Patescibacteria group bacterium]